MSFVCVFFVVFVLAVLDCDSVLQVVFVLLACNDWYDCCVFVLLCVCIFMCLRVVIFLRVVFVFCVVFVFIVT